MAGLGMCGGASRPSQLQMVMALPQLPLRHFLHGSRDLNSLGFCISGKGQAYSPFMEHRWLTPPKSVAQWGNLSNGEMPVRTATGLLDNDCVLPKGSHFPKTFWLHGHPGLWPHRGWVWVLVPHLAASGRKVGLGHVGPAAEMAMQLIRVPRP